MTDIGPLRHFRIYVYVNARPPHGEPQPVSLCPGRRFTADELVGSAFDVTCPECRRFIREIGL